VSLHSNIKDSTSHKAVEQVVLPCRDVADLSDLGGQVLHDVFPDLRAHIAGNKVHATDK
jgi:hypothetical protein